MIKETGCKLVILNGARETWFCFLNFKKIYKTLFISHTEIEPLKIKTEPIKNLVAIFKSYKNFLNKVDNVYVFLYVYNNFKNFKNPILI